MDFRKITPFLIFFGLAEIILLFIAFYYSFFENTGGMALAATLAYISIIIIFILLLIERWIIRLELIKNNYLWIGEIAVLSVFIMYVLINGISVG